MGEHEVRARQAVTLTFYLPTPSLKKHTMTTKTLVT